MCSGSSCQTALDRRARKQNGKVDGKAMVYIFGDESTCKPSAQTDTGYYTEFVGDDTYTTGSMYWFPNNADPANIAKADLSSYTLNDICTHAPSHEMASSLCDGWVSLPNLTDPDDALVSCDSGSSEYYDSSYSSACSACQSSGYSDSDTCGQIPSFRWFYMQQYYPNPYCITNETETLKPLKREDTSDTDFGSACVQASISEITEAKYSSADRWLKPADLRDLSYEDFFCFPKTLANQKECF